jgi:hypothetical protein
MTASTPLEGSELIDCARANAPQGIEEAALRCGYGQELERFKQELKQACGDMGIDLHQFADLIPSTVKVPEEKGVIIAPDSPEEF